MNEQKYTAHLARDEDSTLTLCGHLWESWQCPPEAKSYILTSVPRPHHDLIYFCQDCYAQLRYTGE